jgi:hypothetical protein
MIPAAPRFITTPVAAETSLLYVTFNIPDVLGKIEPSIMHSLSSKLGDDVPVTTFPDDAMPPHNSRAVPSAAIGMETAIEQLIVAGNVSPTLNPVVPSPTFQGMQYLNVYGTLASSWKPNDG